MICEEWLTEDQNKKFDISSHVAESGKAWGDEDNPEELETKALQLKVEKNKVVQKNKAKSVKKLKLGKASKAQKKANKDAEKEVKQAAKEAKKKSKDGVGMEIDSPIHPDLRGEGSVKRSAYVWVSFQMRMEAPDRLFVVNFYL